MGRRSFLDNNGGLKIEHERKQDGVKMVTAALRVDGGSTSLAENRGIRPVFALSQYQNNATLEMIDGVTGVDEEGRSYQRILTYVARRLKISLSPASNPLSRAVSTLISIFLLCLQFSQTLTTSRSSNAKRTEAGGRARAPATIDSEARVKGFWVDSDNSSRQSSDLYAPASKPHRR
ncbi:hypothetical protein Dimus_022266 [Dionaea muscipula]